MRPTVLNNARIWMSWTVDKRDGLDPEIGRGDILLVELAFCHLCRAAARLEQTGVAQHDQGSIDGILRPAIG